MGEQIAGGKLLRMGDKQFPKQAPAELPDIHRPRIPQAIGRMIADPFEYDDGSRAEWQLPATLPSLADIEAAQRQLEAYVHAAPEKFMRECLARLALVLGFRDGSASTWTARAGEYLRLLGHFPADIWQRCCDEVALAKGQRFFPEPSVLAEAMQRELDRRKAAIWRCQRIADAIRKAAANDQPKIPRVERLRATVAAWHKTGKPLPDTSTVKTVLYRSGAAAERELATIEGREPEAWAVAPEPAAE